MPSLKSLNCLLQFPFLFIIFFLPLSCMVEKLLFCCLIFEIVFVMALHILRFSGFCQFISYKLSGLCSDIQWREFLFHRISGYLQFIRSIYTFSPFQHLETYLKHLEFQNDSWSSPRIYKKCLLLPVWKTKVKRKNLWHDLKILTLKTTIISKYNTKHCY